MPATATAHPTPILAGWLRSPEPPELEVCCVAVALGVAEVILVAAPEEKAPSTVSELACGVYTCSREVLAKDITDALGRLSYIINKSIPIGDIGEWTLSSLH
jgi:hypothetical protein